MCTVCRLAHAIYHFGVVKDRTSFFHTPGLTWKPLFEAGNFTGLTNNQALVLSSPVRCCLSRHWLGCRSRHSCLLSGQHQHKTAGDHWRGSYQGLFLLFSNQVFVQCWILLSLSAGCLLVKGVEFISLCNSSIKTLFFLPALLLTLISLAVFLYFSSFGFPHFTHEPRLLRRELYHLELYHSDYDQNDRLISESVMVT